MSDEVSSSEGTVAHKPTVAPYPYQPLRKDTFTTRILILQAAESRSSKICCELSEASILDPEEFEALSYTWDDHVESEHISLDGITRCVTRNLAEFLRHRRQRAEPVKLWIDALCINQNDTEEKARQVKNMNLIYASAHGLVIWLGPVANDSDLAVEELRSLGSEDTFAKMPILSGRALEAVQKFLDRPWWSRVWIRQEVFFGGGGGAKLTRIRVNCGEKEIWWTTLVIAAARMQAQKDDQRQMFPTVETILNLEILRYQLEEIISLPADEALVLDTLSSHRHTKSTDPRDKIYGLVGMIFGPERRPYRSINITYSASVEDVYRGFALTVLRGSPGVELLRHCHSRSLQSLPSWVPDWSAAPSELPLPGMRHVTSERKDPWWLRPIKKDQAAGNAPFHYLVPSRAKEQDVPAGDVIPHLEVFHGPGSFEKMPESIRRFIPVDLLEDMSNMMNSGEVIFSHVSGLVPDDATLNREQDEPIETFESRVVQKGEIVSKLRAHKRNAALIAESKVRYRAAKDTTFAPPSTDVVEVLQVEGIFVDTISAIHEPFVDGLEEQWERSTDFMIAVGQCKKMALVDYPEPNPYASKSGREEAFWLTLFAGRTEIIGTFGEPMDIRNEMRFQEWLPPIPRTWRCGLPPLTATETGRLETAEYGMLFDRALNDHQTELLEFEMIKPEGRFIVEMPGLEMFTNLLPYEWDAEDKRMYSEKFNVLASKWQLQPYDLYHRPFGLPTVVPDPYWTPRHSSDTLAREKARRSPLPIYFGSAHEDEQLCAKLQEISQNATREFVPMIPKDTLEPGFEKWALGRRFIITKKGYLGLAPARARKNDRVAILFGSDVPFILRKRDSQPGFEIVGETYVHEMMDGEVIDQWQAGQSECGTIPLY